MIPRHKPTALDAVIGQHVRDLRKEAGISQAEFSAVLDCEQSMISMLEKGQRNWTTQYIEAVCEKFKIEPAQLVGGVVLSKEDADDLDLIRRHREAKIMQRKALAALKPKAKTKR